MADELPKKYSPAETEERIYRLWENAGAFQAQTGGGDERQPYCIVIPPPNVTGVLHMGHALNIVMQDMPIRYHRMRGDATLWQPGTDHAGIATQAIVEQVLWKEERKTRFDIGNAALLEKIWAWCRKHGDHILKQTRRMGASCDWTRSRFTMDDGLAAAVRTVFVRLYKDGLIVRGKRLVNWDCTLQTGISDAEVENEERLDKLYYFRYPIEGSEADSGNGGASVLIATTRPETMMGDTAVAAHPEDERYKSLIGKKVKLPLVGRLIPVVADESVDRSFGTGCLKVTPAHDAVDWEIGQRHNLEIVNLLNKDGTLNENAGEFKGIDRLKARPQVVEKLQALGVVEKIEDYRHSVGICDRSKDIVEPYLSDQWYMNMKPLAEAAIKAVEDGTIRFHPPRWADVYLNWMRNIQDWCISRQLVWGHPIPIWRDLDSGEFICEEFDPTQNPAYKGRRLEQDPDVLDTWFSSALWPFSTLGWPENTPELRTFYPTNLLVTDRGIIFLWVARMIMMGYKFLKQPPFRDVYITATILDKQGAKMSKSARNGIDPMVLIGGGHHEDKYGKMDITTPYGADGVRFALTTMTAEGQDVRIHPGVFKEGLAFCDKLWNAARFTLMCAENMLELGGTGAPARAEELGFLDRWVLSKLEAVVARATERLEGYAYFEYAQAIRDFIWNEYCSWYLEGVKDLIAPGKYEPKGPHSRAGQVALQTLAHVLDRGLRLLHPVTPFVTEEIWQHLGRRLPVRDLLDDRLAVDKFLMRSAWPKSFPDRHAEAIEAEMEDVKAVIGAVRSIRAQSNIPPRVELALHLSVDTAERGARIEHHRRFIESQTEGRIAAAAVGLAAPARSAGAAVAGGAIKLYIPLTGVIDLDKEIARLQKEIVRVEKGVEGLAKKLSNPDFAKNAPPEVLEAEQAKEQGLKVSLETLRGLLANLSP
ncbi:MAG: valine--tRNA ligase [Planctomycetota bacterium]